MLDNLVKDNIKDLQAYKVEPSKGMIKLDANENNNLSYLLNEKLARALTDLKINEYPDSDCIELRAILSDQLNLDADQIMVTCGSDQLIQIIMTAFVGKGDKMLTHVPTFGMYKIGTQTAGGTSVEVALNDDFSFNIDRFLKAIEEEGPKIIFLTNPNNPTGNIIPRNEIIKIIESSGGIVVVDEAYYEFYGESVIDLVNKYDNLIVLRTLSKAYGLAGARVGYGLASRPLMDILYKVKPPYNVASLSQLAAKVCLANKDIMTGAVDEIIKERDKMAGLLKDLPNFKIYDTHANFVLCKIDQAKKVYDYLLDNKVLVRYFGEEGPLGNCLRISIGTKEENDLLIDLLRKFSA